MLGLLEAWKKLLDNIKALALTMAEADQKTRAMFGLDSHEPKLIEDDSDRRSAHEAVNGAAAKKQKSRV